MHQALHIPIGIDVNPGENIRGMCCHVTGHSVIDMSLKDGSSETLADEWKSQKKEELNIKIL